MIKSAQRPKTISDVLEFVMDAEDCSENLPTIHGEANGLFINASKLGARILWNFLNNEGATFPPNERYQLYLYLAKLFAFAGMVRRNEKTLNGLTSRFGNKLLDEDSDVNTYLRCIETQYGGAGSGEKKRDYA